MLLRVFWRSITESNWADYYIGIFLALTSIILAHLYAPGMQATDDMMYAVKADHIIKHGFYLDGTSHQIGRIATYLPLAVVFRFFGVSNFTLSIIPLLSTAITASAVYILGRMLSGKLIGFLAGILFVCSPLALTFGNIFVPEPMICAELSVATVLFLSSKDSHGRWANTKLLFAGVLCGVAYLTSEVGFLMPIILLLYLAISRQTSKRFAWLIAGFILVICCELLFFSSVYGNAFYRFTSLGGNYTNDPGLIHDNNKMTWRLFRAYPGLFLYPQFGLWLYGPFLAIAAVYGVFTFKRNTLLVVWLLVISLFYNFMTVSFSKYVVLPTSLRLIYPACIPLFILSAQLIVHVWHLICDRPPVERRFLQIVSSALIFMVISSSLFYSHTKANSHFSSIVARNAELAALALRNEPSITAYSDGLTLIALSFYRGFKPADTLINISEYQSVVSEKQNDRVDLRKGKLIISGPIFRAPKDQGGFFPYDPGVCEGLEKGMLDFRVQTYDSGFVKGRLFDLIGNWDPILAIYGPGEYALARAQLANSWVKIFSI